MYNQKKILCLINARGGSKGVPGKNIKELEGKPLIAYSIESAKKSALIDRIIVSTDDEKIAETAIKYGADAPFLRPSELATDSSRQIDAILHAVSFVEDRGEYYDCICILQPTCPFRSSDDIDGSLSMLIDAEADSVIAITDVGGRHPRTLYRKENDDRLSPYLESDPRGVLRQGFESLYWRTGSVYAMKRDTLMKDKSLYGKTICGYEVPEERSFNIDSPFDWELCEAYLQYKTKSEY